MATAGELRKRNPGAIEKLRLSEEEKRSTKEIIERQKTYHCSFGQAIFRKGARKVVWNDDALLGYAVEHPEIEQFRAESEGNASVVLKIGDRI